MDVTGNQCWRLKAVLSARLMGSEEMIELPSGQELITIATYRNGEVEITA